MKHNNHLPDLSTVEHTSDSIRAFGTQFKQTTPHCLGVRHPQVSTMFFHQFSQAQIVGSDAGRQGQHIRSHTFRERKLSASSCTDISIYVKYCVQGTRLIRRIDASTTIRIADYTFADRQNCRFSEFQFFAALPPFACPKS